MDVFKKVNKKSRECHNHKPHTTPDIKRKRKIKKLNTYKTNKQMLEKHTDQLPLPFFLSLDTALGHVWPAWQVWVWRISYQKQQEQDNNTNLWQSHLSWNYLQAVLRDRHTKPCPCPTLCHYILDLNPSTVSAETASDVSPFQVAIVLGKKEFFISYMH